MVKYTKKDFINWQETKSRLNKQVKKDRFEFAKKETNSKSLAYVFMDDSVYKALMNKTKREVITVFEFVDVYSRTFIFDSSYYDNKKYRVTIFPDCYVSTNSKASMTKIYELDFSGDIIKKIPTNHPFFDGLFDAAWNMHIAMKGLNKNEAFDIKAKTIEVFRH